MNEQQLAEREAALNRREQALEEREAELAGQEPPAQPPGSRPQKEKKDPMATNAFEKFYDHFAGVPLKYIDIFIGVCVAALVVVVVVGALKGNGLL